MGFTSTVRLGFPKNKKQQNNMHHGLCRASLPTGNHATRHAVVKPPVLIAYFWFWLWWVSTWHGVAASSAAVPLGDGCVLAASRSLPAWYRGSPSRGVASASLDLVEEALASALVSKTLAARATSLMWQAWEETSLTESNWVYLAHFLVMAMVPLGAKHGRTSRSLEGLVATVVAIRTLVRLRGVFCKPCLPAWATNNSGVLPPRWRQQIASHDTSLGILLRKLLAGDTSVGLGSVYGLFTVGSLYIGKASVTRAHSVPGLPARFAEHVRCVLCPWLRDSGKPRYKTIRGEGFQSLMWLLVLATASVQMALAAEFVSIRI